MQTEVSDRTNGRYQRHMVSDRIMSRDQTPAYQINKRAVRKDRLGGAVIETYRTRQPDILFRFTRLSSGKQINSYTHYYTKGYDFFVLPCNRLLKSVINDRIKFLLTAR